jgi:trans-aconitate 2-methyltransferase
MIQSMPTEWNATAYDRVAQPMTRWGASVVDRLELAGHERVLDAGCGTGRVTELLVERLPRGYVVALDASAAMLEQARARLGRFGGRIEFVQQDLGRPFEIRVVDAIVSTATFHWVPDHEALFGNLAAVLRPGGRLAAQFGGAGNIAELVGIARSVDPAFDPVAHFETEEATARRLEHAGFRDVRTWLADESERFADLASLETYLANVALREHVATLEDGAGREFVSEVAARLPHSTIRYVRLNVDAIRGR